MHDIHDIHDIHHIHDIHDIHDIHHIHDLTFVTGCVCVGARHSRAGDGAASKTSAGGEENGTARVVDDVIWRGVTPKRYTIYRILYLLMLLFADIYHYVRFYS